MPTIFELRASLGVRIVIDSIELEPGHPNISIDGNSARRHAWQSIARAALGELGAGVEQEPEPKPRRKKRGPKPRPARFIVGSIDDARALLALKPTPIDETHLACIVCARSFVPEPKHRHRQRLCGSPRCVQDWKNAHGRVRRAEKGAAS